MSFNEMNLPSEIVGNLTRMGISAPTEIQRQSIPNAILGMDILASSQTGSGKTLAYLLPAITKILQENAKVLVLAPTRELAVQVCAALMKTVGKVKISGAAVIGGEPFGKQVSKLMTKPDVIVATPGRLIDHINRGTVKLANFGYLVLDEMDRMLDMGMKEQIDEISKQLPAKRQVLMFSATLPNHIAEASRKYLNNPHKITIGKANQAAIEIVQEFIDVKEEGKYIELDRQLSSKEGTAIVFVKTKRGADKLARNLKNNGHRADAIHGDLNQSRRTRVLDDFRRGKSRILVATDVAARGLDVDHIQYVFNYDLPTCPEDYLHRIGRTGRAGAKGFAISFVCGSDVPRRRAIERLINMGESTRESFKSGGRSGGGARNNNERRTFGDRKPSSGSNGGFGGRSGERKKSDRPFGDRRNDSSTGFFKKKKRPNHTKAA
jgi:ATP-dependent RNA helicase DeaD